VSACRLERGCVRACVFVYLFIRFYFVGVVGVLSSSTRGGWVYDVLSIWTSI
jgi:hypothetical protein